MTSFTDLLQQGAANVWFFIPSAILLGALHGLEPGHSKTMMAAFIIAIRGTVLQAVLLGLAATISHTAIVWAIALTGLYFGSGAGGEAWEPYLQIASGIIIIGVALWMVWRTWRDQTAPAHHTHDEAREIETGHGVLRLEVFEDGAPPRWRVYQDAVPAFGAFAIAVETIRPDGARQSFSFVEREGFLESHEEIPEPHAFKALLKLGIRDEQTIHELDFDEHHHHDHDESDQDAHERAHAADIQRRFANRQATTPQIVMFGLTGGLIPCPASITVLLICLQLKQFALGATLVLSFSVGLALTMVAVGTAAALSVRHVANRWDGFNILARRAPYFSSALIVAVGVYSIVLGYAGLSGHA